MRSDPHGTPPTPASRARRRHALALAALMALTLAAGAAARLPFDGVSRDVSPQTVASTRGPIRMTAQLDRGSVLRNGDGSLRAELVIGAQAGHLPRAERTPTDLVVILDRSGSMQGPPLDFAKAAVGELIEQLAGDDRFALVSYASAGEIAIPLALATPDTRSRWRQRLSAISASGGTNLAQGLDLAHSLIVGARQAGRVPRVILLSDGHANEGDHSLAGLRSRAGRAISGEYVLSSVGIGAGFDETLMSAVADAGTGNFYYLPDLTHLAGVFSAEFASARETIASALEVMIAPGDGVTVESASGYPLERDGETVRLRPGDLASGQERRIWITLRVPTGVEGEIALGELSLRYRDTGGQPHELALPELPRVACVAGEDDYYASFEREVYLRGSRSEGLGQLKQKVAQRLRSGDQAEAVFEVDHFMADLKNEQLRALGYVDAQAFAPAESLRDSVAAPSAAHAPAQNRLGKQLLEEGRDQRRAGSKR